MPSSEVMTKWKEGKLRSGGKSGPVVQGQKQAVAIMLSEKRKEKSTGKPYKDSETKKARAKKQSKSSAKY